VLEMKTPCMTEELQTNSLYLAQQYLCWHQESTFFQRSFQWILFFHAALIFYDSIVVYCEKIRLLASGAKRNILCV